MSTINSYNTPGTPPVASAPPQGRTNPDPTRPGFATTEFWGALVAPVVFLILSQFNVAHIDTTDHRIELATKLGSYVLAAVGTGFYALSRGHMKKGAAIGAAISDFLVYVESSLPVNRDTTKDLVPAQLVAGELASFTPKFSDQQRDEITQIIELSLGKFLKPKPTPGPAVKVAPVPTPAPVEPEPIDEPVTAPQPVVDALPPESDTFVAPTF